MPHKRAKRSVREANSKALGYNNAPTASDSANHSGLSKTMQRILNAEKVRGAHRKKQADKKKAQEQGMFSQSQPSQPLAESSKAGSSAPGQGNKKNKLQIQEGESLKAFSRRAEESLRGDINTAMRSASKKSNTESLSADKSKKRKREPEPQEPKIKHQPVDQRIAEKRAKAAEKSGNIVKEGVADFEVAPRLGVNEVAEAPPSLGAWTKKSRTKSGKNANPTGISIMQQEALEKQRSEAIQRYRELKQGKSAQKE